MTKDQGLRTIRSASAERIATRHPEVGNVSRHLAQLRSEGIVQRRAEGNRAIYRINDPTIIEICEIVCSGLAEHLSEGLEALPKQALS